ncbi:MAG: fatty acid--CoA ligase family protein [Novosphingobium sp.]|nr:fatty acid--CoA ligase family protein [Novosphingobium sp.]
MERSCFEQRIRETLRADPQAMAVDHDGGEYSWTQFAELAGAVESILDRLAIPDGTPVGLIGRNLPPHFAGMIGIFIANCCTSMVYAFQSATALAADIAATSWPVVFGEQRDWTEEVIAAADAAGTVGFAFDEGSASGFARVTRRDGPDPELLAGEPHDIAIQLLSSGTTGKPKRISLDRDAVDEMIERTIFQFELSGPTGDATQIIPWPIVSLGGVNALLPAMALGQTIAIQERFDAEGMLGLIRKYRPPFLSLPPSGLARMLLLDPPKSDLESVKLYFSGTAPLDPHVRQRMMDEYEIPVAEAYGATEFAGIVSSWVPEDMHLMREKAGSVGRELPGISIRIVSPETGEELPQGERGLIEALVPRIGEDWVRTNDVAWLDEDGFVFLEGRADDAIIRGGFKIVPEEVAELLRLHPLVGDAALVGIADARSGQLPAAVIEPRDPLDPPSEEALLAFLKERLPSYKLPARWAIVPEIPRTATLKPRREGLRALFEELPS